MPEPTTNRAGRRLVLPLLAGLLAATAGVFLWAVDERMEVDAAYARAESDLRLPLRVREGRGRVGDPERRGALVREPTNPAEVRSMVAFCDTARASDVAALRDTALRAEDPLAAANAVRALGRLRAVRGDAEVEALLQDARPRVRDETILALGESRDAGAIVLLEPFVRGDDAKARVLAIRAIGRLGGGDARTLLESVVRSPSATREDLAFAKAGLGGAAR